jgi:DNA repair protein RadD
LLIQYIDIEGNDFKQTFNFATPAQRKAFYAVYVLSHTRTPGIPHPQYKKVTDVLADQTRFRKPDLLLLKKNKHRWDLVDSFFDYQGKYKIDMS